MTGTIAPRFRGASLAALLVGLAVAAAQPGTAEAAGLQVRTDTSPYLPWARLVTSTVNEEARPSRTLTLTNTSASPLTISAMTVGASPEAVNALAGREGDYDRASDFQFAGVPSLPLTLAPGGSLTLSVAFAPSRNATRPDGQVSHTTDGENYALLSIFTDDPSSPVTRVGLAGLDSVAYAGSDEASASEIVRSFGFGTDIGSNKHKIGGSLAPIGDEVLVPYLVAASPGVPVQVWPLGLYSGASTVPHGNVQIKAKAGSTGPTCKKAALYNFPGGTDRAGGENQKLAPLVNVNGTAAAPTAEVVGRIMGCPFEVIHTGSSTDDALNAGGAHNWRIYPARDQEGRLVPNNWIGISDPTPVTATAKNYDYQDGVFLFANVRPESAALDPSVPGPAPGAASLALGFSAAVPGTLADQQGLGTGFGATQRNKFDTFTTTPSHDPSLLALDLAAGTLSVTTGPGSPTTKDNSLVNGLQVRFDGRAQPFAVTASLSGPLSAINTPKNQQAGIFFGPGQDDYVKLVVRATGVNAVAAEFVRERRGALTVVGRLPLGNPAQIAGLELTLNADPTDGTVTATYRKTAVTGGTGPVTAVPGTVTLEGADLGRFFDPQSKAGIIAYNGTEPSFQAVYDRFVVEAATP